MDAKVPCDLCDPNPNNLAYGRCLDCEENMCQSCCLAHERSKATKHHKIQDLGTLDPETKGKIRQRTLCDDHPGEEIKLVCQNCNVLMCFVCKAVNHDNHTSKPVADAAAELKRSLEDELRKCDEKLQHLSMSEKEHEKCNKIINDAECRDIEAIEKQYSMLLHALETEVIRKKREIRTVYKEYRERNERNSALIQSETMRYVSAMTDLQKLVNQGTTIEILKNGPALKLKEKRLDISTTDTKLETVFRPTEVEPRGITAFLLGNVQKERSEIIP
ncbi:hypothetical protein ACJMK2_002759, partial [Sinanodonta woodiana]